MTELIQVLDEHVRVVIFVGIGLVIIVSTIAKALTNMFTTAAREKSRREIAAYIAEGSMTPEQGERLMKAESPGARNACL